MQSYNDLQSQLKTIDHKSYPLYKSLRGSYQFPKYILSIDHVQGDPFAAPSDGGDSGCEGSRIPGICDEG